MSFVDLRFWLLFPALFLVYHLLPGARSRIWLLLTGSLFFYGAWNWWYLSLIFFSAGLDYFCGSNLHRTEHSGWRRFWLGASLTGNLGLLFFFKYWGLFAQTVSGVSGKSVPLFDLLLPIGISFYTFQTLSYTIDIYRRKRGPEKSFPLFLLYVSFFPQLVAGPIERSSTLLPQLQKLGRPNLQQFREGLLLIAWGVFLKLVGADNMRVFVNSALHQPDAYPTAALWFASYSAFFMIYVDFLAYTEIARGLGRLFGVSLSSNFSQPFFSTTIGGFWQRWHITLTRWIFDYVASPLYRTFRQSWVKPAITVFVMALFGLWHGASWNFVIFGTWFGLCVAVWRPLESQLKRSGMSLRKANLIRRPIMWAMLAPGVTMFYIPEISDLAHYLGRMFGIQSSPVPTEWSLLVPGVGALCAWIGVVTLLIADVHDHRSDITWWEKLALHRSSFLRWGIGTGLLFLTALLAAPNRDAFVYFQF